MGALKQSITKEYLSALENISLTVKNKMSGGYSGMRKSTSRGSSQEFSDYRDYSPGDDVRNIDWNSFSRFDRLFLKLFSEEKQAEVSIFLDKSESMDFGTPNKFLFARQVAASIAYVAVKNLDRVSIFSLDENIVLEKSNVRSKGGFPEAVNFLDGIKAGGGTRINQVVKSVAKTSIHQGASFLITDLYSQDGFEDAVKALQSKKNEVTIIHVMSPEEISPTISGPVRLWDSETSEVRDLIITTDVLERYTAAFEAYTKSIADYCYSRNVRYVPAVTDSNVLKIFY